jgi:hypothetical protein
VKQSEHFQSPPWNQVEVNIDINFINERKLDTSEYNEQIKEYMEKYKDRLKIYTDAAKDKNEKVAYAIYIPELEVSIARRMTDGTSIDTAETQAMYTAIK